MISFEEAYKIVQDSAVQCGTENIAFTAASGRVLAGSVMADINMPPFDKSAVDGFACKKSDVPGNLVVVETIPAGSVPKQEIFTGQCARIMTGAMIPCGADSVVMVEDVEDSSENIIRVPEKINSANIAYKAEDIRLGECILDAGTLLGPQHIAVLATVGQTQPLVYRKPMIVVISTGDELVEPWEKPAGAMIRNSNAWQIISQAQETGATASYGGIAADTPESVRLILENAMEKGDIVILTGGVSMGDFDYVPAVLKGLGIEILFKSIAIQPGRPTVFGKKGNQLFFGLPGNPVSAFVQFELLVKPLIAKMSGRNFEPVYRRLPLVKTIKRKKALRKSIIPVIIKDNIVYPVEYHGSAHINAYTAANGMLAMETGIFELTEGTEVNVRQL